jgi:hypothetical protein
MVEPTARLGDLGASKCDGSEVSQRGNSRGSTEIVKKGTGVGSFDSTIRGMSHVPGPTVGIAACEVMSRERDRES